MAARRVQLIRSPASFDHALRHLTSVTPILKRDTKRRSIPERRQDSQLAGTVNFAACYTSIYYQDLRASPPPPPDSVFQTH
ncbi:hypothetical protein M407DRAFT_201123 [Tulasnella calospora MUT 4182]|uniref:Uncharacterized protein n=1 Tax=Tulasnella calospora MUT 4182 TaxID=1051891 RepID=A0A0C3QJM8_9AGAM|nr:hypothetical protein M407DRAFT_201123 [Tulasnella calospora MUT 4182]